MVHCQFSPLTAESTEMFLANAARAAPPLKKRSECNEGAQTRRNINEKESQKCWMDMEEWIAIHDKKRERRHEEKENQRCVNIHKEDNLFVNICSSFIGPFSSLPTIHRRGMMKHQASSSSSSLSWFRYAVLFLIFFDSVNISMYHRIDTFFILYRPKP